MAFTEEQKELIRQYLGFSSGYVAENTRLESEILAIGTVATEQAQIESLLTKIAAVETAIQASGSSSTTQGALKRADDVEFYEPSSETGSSMTAVAYGNLLIARLAARFGYRRQELPSQYFSLRPFIFGARIVSSTERQW